MNSIVVGRNGLIAKRIVEKIYEDEKMDSKLLFTTSTKKSIDKETVLLDLSKPNDFDYSVIKKFSNIIMLGGISSPDKCEKNPKKSKSINFDGTKLFIQRCIELNAKVLFFSTDLVYGKSKLNFNELSNVEPNCNYSSWKNGIEKTFQGNKNFKVFRLSYVMSFDDKFFQYLLQCKRTKSIAEIYHPFYRNVIFIDDIILATFNIFNMWDIKQQIINVCGEESISRKDIAKKVLDDNQINVVDPGDDFWNIRPQVINVESIYLKSILQKKPTSFDTIINKLKNHRIKK